jgi:translation initiation factor 3 subunit E
MEDIAAALADGLSILPKLAPQLSRHLLFPLIEFEAGQAEERGEDDKARMILGGKIKMLESTNMADYVANLFTELHGGEPPAEFTKKRQEVLTQLEKFEQDTEKLSDLLTREDVVGGLRSDKVANLEFLKKEHEVSQESIFPGMKPFRNTDEKYTGHDRHGQRPLRFRPVPVPLRQLRRGS